MDSASLSLIYYPAHGVVIQNVFMCICRGDSMKYDRANYNRLFVGELYDWGFIGKYTEDDAKEE